MAGSSSDTAAAVAAAAAAAAALDESAAADSAAGPVAPGVLLCEPQYVEVPHHLTQQTQQPDKDKWNPGGMCRGCQQTFWGWRWDLKKCESCEIQAGLIRSHPPEKRKERPAAGSDALGQAGAIAVAAPKAAALGQAGPIAVAAPKAASASAAPTAAAATAAAAAPSAAKRCSGAGRASGVGRGRQGRWPQQSWW